MPQLSIDGIAVEVPAGTTLMEAAEWAGIEIPALCHVKGVRPLTSCMLCVVKETNTGQTLPSCSAKAEDGMVIETNNDEIRAARRDVLELLLSEHVGDCEAPCRRICSASLDVSSMMRLVRDGDLELAARLAKETLILPATLGYVCSAPCERGCHRGTYDEPLLVRGTHRWLAEEGLPKTPATPLVPLPPATGKKVAIVGAGVAGLAAAWMLQRYGHACTLFDKRDGAGGPLRDLDEDELPRAVLEREVDDILQLGVELVPDCEIGRDRAVTDLLDSFDALVVASDDVESEGDQVFTAVEFPMAVNAVAEGKRTAESVHRFLCGEPEAPETKPFDNRLGPLEDADKAAFLEGRTDPSRVPEQRHKDDLSAEATRCLHCECLKPSTCKLRRYAEEYNARQYEYGSDGRPPVEPIRETVGILYESGKCIRCGLCVEITSRTGEALGLAFVGRGFDVRVRVPFNRTLREGLARMAGECIDACPTGALAYRNRMDEHT